jgi:hypothetical protein
MSSDNSVDGQVDWFFACFIVPLRFLAAHVLPASMAAYVYAMELWRQFVTQFNRTVTAILDSFHPEIIIFYEDEQHHYPIATVRRDKHHVLTGHHSWTYDISNQTFHDEFCVEPRSLRIPYLGASLSYTFPNPDDGVERSISIGDLSDWIADQTIRADTNELPIQVLVTAWAYTRRIPLMIGYKGYVLTVMTEDGDEVSYSLSEFEDASESNSSSVSVTSSTEEARGEIQIIGERILPQSLYDLLVPHAPTNTPLPASPETVSSNDSCEEGELKKNK